MTPHVEETLTAARYRLSKASFGPPTREAALLLSRVLGLSEAQLLSHSRDEVPTVAARQFSSLLERRLTGEPVAYLLEEKEFFGRPFLVDRRVLIPRPETEHLVESALEQYLPPSPLILDVGTGSGCIGLTLALELPTVRVVATDLSPGALAVARTNARCLGVEDRVRLVATDLARCLDLTRFDLVVSNPPYIDHDEAEDLSPEVRCFEPATALFSPPDAHGILERVLNELQPVKMGTPLVVEIGLGQSDKVQSLASGSRFELMTIRPDYAGIPRVAIFRRR
ncbi:MAG: peptide chain release factor N(5)-glutamine methyltransferase [Thermoanaerobaculia bacterium]